MHNINFSLFYFFVLDLLLQEASNDTNTHYEPHGTGSDQPSKKKTSKAISNLS